MANSFQDIFATFNASAASTSRDQLLSSLHAAVDSSDDEPDAGPVGTAADELGAHAHGGQRRSHSAKRKHKSSDKKERKSKRHRHGKDGDAKTDLEKGLVAQIALARSGTYARQTYEPWTSDLTPAAPEPYRSHTRGDADNLVFAAPYRADVPAYVRGGWAGESAISAAFKAFLFRDRNAFRRQDQVNDVVHIKLRYFSSNQLRRERDRRARRYHRPGRARRLRMLGHAPEAPSSVRRPDEWRLGGQAEAGAEGGPATEDDANEGALKQTASFSAHTFANPHDVHAWLQYVAFQPTLIKASGYRCSDSAIAGKQLAILEKALQHNPDSEELLTVLIVHVLPKVVDESELEGRWRELLRRRPTSFVLWSQHLLFMARRFTAAPLAELSARHEDAVMALAVGCARGAAAGASGSVGEQRRAEAETCALLLRHVALELHCGRVRRAMALVQASLEWHAFRPQLVGSTLAALTSWFRGFWQSDAPKIGEKGAQGFDHWVAVQHGAAPALEHGDEDDLAAASPAAADDAAAGAWTGWFDAPEDDESARLQQSAEAADAAERAGDGPAARGADDEDEDLEAVITEQPPTYADELDDELLRIRLGIEAEQGLEELESKGLDPAMLARYLQLERQRASVDDGTPGASAADEEDEAPEAATVGLGAVRHVLFGISSPDVLRAWAAACLAVFDVPITCLNGPHPSALFPSADSRGDHLSPSLADGLTGMDLGAELGLPTLCPAAAVVSTVSPRPGERDAARRDGGAEGALRGDALPAWMPTTPFECQRAAPGRDEAPASGSPTPPRAWFAASAERHVTVKRLISALRRSAALKADPVLTRAAFAVEAAPIGSPDDPASPAETAAVAAERARRAAKALLAKPEAAKDAAMWSAFVALEAALGRTKQALHALTATMGGLGGLGPAALAHRWQLALQFALLELADAGLRLGFGGAGSAFDAPERDRSRDDDPQSVRQAAALERAFSALVWAATGAKQPFNPPKKAAGSVPAWPAATLTAAQQGYQAAIAGAVAAGRQMSDERVLGSHPLPASTDDSQFFAVSCAMAFEVVGAACGALPTGGVERALRVFEHCMAAASHETQTTMAQYAAWSCVAVTLPLLQRHALSPGTHRALILRLLTLHPSSPYLAAALAALDQAAHALSRLRLDLAALTAQPRAQSSVALQLCAAACEAGRPGGFRLRNLFEKSLAPRDFLELAISCTARRDAAPADATEAGAAAVSGGRGGQPHADRRLPALPAHPDGRQRDSIDDSASGVAAQSALLARGGMQDCPVIWIAYMQWLASQGRPADVRSVFLRAVNACPWSKGLWMTGLGLAAESLHGREASELVEAMLARGVAMKTHTMEVLLEALDD